MEKFTQIKEGKAKAYVPIEKKVSKDLPVFYNPVMEYNRTISVAVLNALNRKGMSICLPLEATGIRAIRFIKECGKSMIKDIIVNDYDTEACKLIKKNLHLNSIKSTDNVIIKATCKDANLLFNEERAFDYIDIDPFGTPNPFLNNAISRLKRQSILAVTATDTSALCGTFPEVCIRKYWALPMHGEEMHEIGLRILIRKVQLIGMQFEKALLPLLSYSKDHYMRIFFICIKSKKECDSIARQHQMYKNAGPLWVGALKDKEFACKIQLSDKFTEAIKQELDIVGFYDIPSINSREKVKHGKKITEIIDEIRKQGFKASRTHFSEQGIKSNISYEKLVQIIKS